MEYLLQTEPEDIRRKFALVVSRLSTEQLMALKDIAESLVGELRDTAPAPAEEGRPAAAPGLRPMTAAEIDQEVAAYRAELELEARAAEKSSALPKAGGA